MRTTLSRSGLLLALALALIIAPSAWAQDMPYVDGKPMIVTVVSTDGDAVRVRTQDGKEMKVRFAADMPVLERDLQKGDIVKLWTQKGPDGEMTAQVEFAEVAVLKPHVTTRETTDPIANTTDPEAVPSETDPVVVDPALTGSDDDSKARGETEIRGQEGEKPLLVDGQPMRVFVVAATSSAAIVENSDGERMRLEFAADLPVLERDLQKDDVIELWTNEESGDLIAHVDYSEVAVIKPHVTTRETTDPIANTTDPEAVPSETDPVVVDPELTPDTERDRNHDRDDDWKAYAYSERPIVTEVLYSDGHEVIVRTEHDENWKLKLADDIPVLERDLQKGDIVMLWIGEDDQGEQVALVKYSEVAVLAPNVTTRETLDPIANADDPEAVFAEIDPVVVDPELTDQDTEGDTER